MGYSYTALDHSAGEIRLLTLEPSEDHNADLHCTLKIHIWTNGPGMKPSHTHGELRSTQNLEVALRYLRHASDARSLWIDAICIYQADLEERSYQVRRMRDIYACASQVVVWLGKSDENLDFVMNYLISLKNEDDDGYRFPEDNAELAAALPCLEELFTKPWFFRMWTAQELVVAHADPLVVCGHKWDSWRAIDTFIFFLSARQMGGKPALLSVDAVLLFDLYTVRNTWQDTVGGKENEDNEKNEKAARVELTLENLLIATSTRDAGEPRDHIFAVLGLLPKQIEALVPDYEEPVELIYQKAMVEAFRSSRDIELLTQATNSRNQKLPSWSLDFSLIGWNRQRDEFKTYSFMRSKPHSPSDVVDQSGLRHDPDSGSLTLTGSVIGKVHNVYLSTTNSFGIPPGQSGAELTRAVETMDKEERFKIPNDSVTAVVNDYAQLMIIAYPALATRLSLDRARELLNEGVIWRVFAGGESFESTPTDFRQLERIDGPKDFSVIDTWLKRPFGDGKNAEDTNAESSGEPSSSETHQAMLSLIAGIAFKAAGCAFITTDTGYVGRAAHPVQEHDLACVLHGCSRPAVLRPWSDDDDGTYRLVTFAYVHDVVENNRIAVDLTSFERREFQLR